MGQIKKIEQLQNIFYQNISKEVDNILSNIRYHIKNSNDINFKQLKSISDLESLSIKTVSGFYIILTDKPINNNPCSFKYRHKSVTYSAIYRGQAYEMGNRLIGHLFKARYSGKDTNFMNFENQSKGINIDQSPYNDHNWAIITIKLRKCKMNTREVFEQSFENKFGKPIYSTK